MSFNVGQRLLGVHLSRTDTSPEHVLGSRVVDERGVEYVYVQAVNAVAVNAWVSLAANFEVDTTTSGEFAFGVALGAFGADEYGWVAVRGAAVAKVPVSTAAGDALGAANSAQPGVIAAQADTGLGQHLRAVALTAEASGLATVLLV